MMVRRQLSRLPQDGGPGGLIVDVSCDLGMGSLLLSYDDRRPHDLVPRIERGHQVQ